MRDGFQGQGWGASTAGHYGSKRRRGVEACSQHENAMLSNQLAPMHSKAR